VLTLSVLIYLVGLTIPSVVTSARQEAMSVDFVVLCKERREPLMYYIHLMILFKPKGFSIAVLKIYVLIMRIMNLK